MNMTQISKGKKIRSSFVLKRLIRDVLADAKSTHSYSSDIHVTEGRLWDLEDLVLH